MSQNAKRSPRRYRLYSVGEILTLILEAPEDYPLQLVDHTLVHRRAEHAIRVDVTWQGQRRKAMILTRSSDWYRFSLHLYASDEVELVIVGTHDSCLLLPVLSFDSLLPEEKDGKAVKLADGSYQTSPVPTQYTSRQMRWGLLRISEAFRRTEYGHAMLLGGLLCQLPEAYQRLATVESKATRLRINAEVMRLQHRRPGRPVKISEYQHRHQSGPAMVERKEA